MPLPPAAKSDIGNVLIQRILRKHPRGVQIRAFQPDEAKVPEKDPPPANPSRSCLARWGIDVGRFSHTPSVVYEFSEGR